MASPEGSENTNLPDAAAATAAPVVPAAVPQQQQQQPQSTGPTAVEFEPPLACVRRILKTTLPASTNVGKDASAAFARACGIFILYLTSCSNDFAREHKRQTITANDVLAAIQELDFDEFTPDMVKFLESYRAVEKSKKDAKAKAAAAREAQEQQTAAAAPEEDDDEKSAEVEAVVSSKPEEEEPDEEDVEKDRKRPAEDLMKSESTDSDEQQEPEAKRAKVDEYKDTAAAPTLEARLVEEEKSATALTEDQRKDE